MKLFINFFILFCQCQLIVSHPGIVDSSEVRRIRGGEKASSRFPSNQNAITTVESFDGFKSSSMPTSTTTVPPSTTLSGIKTLKLTHEDVVLGANSVYRSHFQQSNPQLPGGGILFAVSGHGGSAPLAQAQPVLLQYISPEGIPKQSSIQYVQLMRPLMMLSAPPSFLQQPMRHMSNSDIPIQMKEAINSFIPQMKSSLIGAHSIPLTTYSRPTSSSSSSSSSDMSLNMNEYMPTAASSRVSTTVFPSSMNNLIGYMPSNHHYSMMAQRA